MSVKIDGTNGIDVAQLRAPDGDPVAMTIDAAGKVALPAQGQLLAGKGYVKLPGGLIIQWDESAALSVPANTPFPFTFDLAVPFPNGFLSAQMSFAALDLIGPAPIYGINGTVDTVSGTVFSTAAVTLRVRHLTLGY